MCGIFSYFSNKVLTKKEILLCRKGISLLKHRGPDGKGEWFDSKKGVYIGHQRLSVIDLTSKARQPMKKKNHVLSYNGEIYNFNELKNKLKKDNIGFFSNSDSEVLLSLWQKKGVSSLNYLDGMFAFVIWDGVNGWVARDKFGEKPIYYTYAENGIFISSELGALVKVLNKKKSLSKKLTASFLSLGYISSPNTAYKNIFMLNPASYLKISKGKVKKKIKYFNIKKSLKKIPRKDKINKKFINKFHDELINSVQSRLYSDAPKCLFLSSGIDSSLIASIISKELNVDIPCITIGFKNQYDESINSKKIAQYLKLPHYISRYNLKQKTSVNDVINLFKQPNDNLNIVSVKKMAKIAKKRKFKVGITGNGGDELTQGYLTQQFINKYKNLYKFPEQIRKLITFLLYPFKNFNNKINLYKDIFGVDNIFLYIALKNNPQIRILKEVPGFKEWCSETFKNFNSNNLYERVSNFDLEDVMPNNRLICFDMGSMSEGVELRSPFLNYKLFEIYQNINPRFIDEKNPKYLLKEILKKYLPEKLIFNYKKGFVYPLNQFIKKNKILDNKLKINQKNFVFKNKKDYSWQKIIIRKRILERFFQ